MHLITLLIISNFSVLVIAATLSIVVAGNAARIALKVRRSNPATIRLACILMAFLPDQAGDEIVPRLIVSLFPDLYCFRKNQESIENSEPLSDKLSGVFSFAARRRISRKNIADLHRRGGSGKKKNGQERLPVRKANPGRLAALWIRLYAGRDFISGSGDHRPAPIKLEHNSFRVSDYCKRITGRFRVCELLCSISPE